MPRLAIAAIAALTVLVVGIPALAAMALAPQPTPGPVALDDVPPTYLAIYRDAAASRCPTLPWSVLAAVGKIESNHGRTGGARLGPDGRVAPPVIGIPLDGTAGTQKISDTDGGLFDRDATHDRAVGPMQFIPTTWTTWGLDASGDGLADPHNALDAIHAAAAYLCAAGADDPAHLTDAIWAYNHSDEYVDAVLTQAVRYS